MKKNIYREVIENVKCAYAYHKAVYDENDYMIDYIFLDVNSSFENLTGLKKENIISKKFLKEVCTSQDKGLSWVERYREVVVENKIIEFEDFSEEFNRYFSIKAYSPEENHFVTVFMDRTFEEKIKNISNYFMENMGKAIDYDKITELAQEISGAEYTVFNLFDRNGKNFKSLSIWGISENINKALNILDFNLIDKNWDYDPIREEKLKNRKINYFDNLHDLTGDVLPEKVIKKLEKTFNIGTVVVARIIKENKTLGDLTLVFKKNHELKNLDLFELYLSQLGLFLEKTRIGKSLKLSQKRFYDLAEYAPIGFVACNIKGDIMYANKKLMEIMGSPSYEDTKNINLLEFPPLKERGFSEKLKESMDKNEEITFEMGYRSLWDKNSWLRIHIKPNEDFGRIIGARIVIDDITEKKKTEEVLKEKANKDPLTNAYNRNALNGILLDKFKKTKEENLKSCIALIDLDNFKEINDTYGHPSGDRILKYFVVRLKKELREEDLLIRAGGDEFIIYLHDIKNKKNSTYFIKRIFNKCSSTYRLEDEVGSESIIIDLSCSIGVAFIPEDGDSLKALIAKADKALYKVKNNGKNGYQL